LGCHTSSENLKSSVVELEAEAQELQLFALAESEPECISDTVLDLVPNSHKLLIF
jgi:hypothetical protein